MTRAHCVHRLESRGDYDQAAGWAFFSGLPHRAIQALGSVRGSGKNGKALQMSRFNKMKS